MPKVVEKRKRVVLTLKQKMLVQQYCVLVSVRWQRGWRRVARQSADLYYGKMCECRVVIVDIISLPFKYPALLGIRHVGGPVDAGKEGFYCIYK